MNRGLLVAVSGAAILIAGLSGCSSDNKEAPAESSASSSAAESSSESSAASETAEASAATKVTIDGQDQDVKGTVVCATMGGNVNIAIGDAGTGIAAVVSEDGSNVTSVGLGNVNGVTLAVGMGAGEAKAVKDGNSWTITGNATGIDMANPLSPVTKPFEIQVTCP